jgi:hypothetical protein
VLEADWAQPADVKEQYDDASILKGSRVVFNIAANKYRLVVRINYPYRVVYVRFVGTHAEYDQIDAQAKRWPIEFPDPIDAIRARMEQQHLRPKDLEPFLGGSGRVSEVLGRRRRLTLTMIRRLEHGLGIPARILIHESEGPPARKSAKRRRTRSRSKKLARGR